jgi:CubicO group peptidase (beta-lactamase class C family)
MLAYLVLAAALVAAPSAPADAELGEKLDRWLVAADFRGNVLVAKGGAVVLRKGYGMADREKGIPYTAETVFDVGSITKQFTAAAILKLEMQGKLHVEDPIGKYFPGVPEDKKAITLHHLLTHTSGLESDFAGDYDPVSRDEYVKRALASKLRTKPGDTHFYANSGYSLLGAIVEIASGKPYEQYLAENLFLPSGMRETGYRLPGWDPKRLAVGYKGGKRWGRITEKPWAADGPYWALRANGGIHSTLDDLLRWHVALAGEKVLSAAEKEKLYARHVREGEGADTFYGYGWSIADAPGGGRLVEHNGGNGVFYADFLRFLDEDLVVILSTNDSEVRGGRTAEALARMCHGDEVPVPKPVSGEAKPLGSDGRDAVVRSWLDAFNAPTTDAMRAFRAAHAVSRPGLDDAERDRRLARMRSDLGHLEIVGVVDRSEEEVVVRAKSERGPTVTLRFQFVREGKLDGVGVEVGVDAVARGEGGAASRCACHQRPRAVAAAAHGDRVKRESQVS